MNIRPTTYCYPIKVFFSSLESYHLTPLVYIVQHESLNRRIRIVRQFYSIFKKKIP